MLIKCKRCGAKPSELGEYIEMVEHGEYKTEDEAVTYDEGTYNPNTGLFYGDRCYISMGMPLGTA